MLFLIILDYLATLNAMVTYLTEFRSKVISIPFRSIYSVEGLRINDEQYIASTEPMTYTDAVTYCRTNGASPFVIRRHLSLKEVFEKLQVQEIWTSIHKHSALGSLSDLDGHPPELETELEEISIVNITLATMVDTTFRVTLLKNDDTYGLQVVLFSAKKHVICQRYLGFPYRGKDLDKLEVLSQTMGSLVQETEDRIYAVTRQTESRLATLPKVTKFETDQETDIFNKQNEINAKSQNSKEQFASIIRNLKMITDVADVTNTMGKLVGQLMNVRYMVEFTLEPLNFPLGLITRTYHPHVDTGIQREYKLTDNVTTPAVLFYYNQTTLILKLGAEQTLQTDETLWKSYFMEKVFNKNTFYTITLVDIILIASSSFVSIMALMGIIINCCNIRNQTKKQKKQNLLYKQALGSRALRVNQVTIPVPASPIQETSFFKRVHRKKHREIGLPTTLPVVSQVKKTKPVVQFIDDLPSHMLSSTLSLNY
jgi:hypothetical protein